MIVFSNHLTKINRVCVITSFNSKFHKSCFLLESKNFKKPDKEKNDLKNDKKSLKEKLAKMSFISLNEKQPEQTLPNNENQDKPKFKHKQKDEYVPSFSFQFSAQNNLNDKSKQPGNLTKAEKSDQNLKENLEKKAQEVAKLLGKNKKEQLDTTEVILDKMVTSFEKKNSLKSKLKNRQKPEELQTEQIKKNKLDLIKLVSVNSDRFSDETKIKNEDLKSKTPENGHVKFQTNNYFQKFQNLTGGNGLSIFSNVKFSFKTNESPVWSMYYDQELQQAQKILPVNGFDELIQLTNQGKLWKFPIDNEQDIDESDAQVPFHEHVFLDHYLEEFPQIEQIQHFMALVLNGLSQNSFLSIKEKKEIIDWYKTYFNDKIDIIKEALEAEKLEESYRESIENK